MDQLATEKEDLSDHRCKDDDVDAEADEGPGMNDNHGDSTDQQRDEEAEEVETPGGVLKEVVGGRGSEEASAPLLAHHPCTLLQLLLRACAGYLGLHGYCGVDDDGPKPAADDDVPAVAAASDSPREGDPPRGGDKAASETEEVVTVVWRAARRRLPPPPPGRPREGPGGNGGNHH